MFPKTPTIDELLAWIDEDLTACRFNFADSNTRGDNERAKLWARRSGYMEAALEVISLFTEETSQATK